MTQESSKLDVIAVGAHPDDVEIGCGGLLAKLVEQGHRVGIVDLTDGEPTPGSPGPEVRLAEARRAAELLGVHERVTLPLPNRRLFDTHENRLELAKVFRRLRPRLVLAIGERTPMASPDHWQAMQLTDAAVFYSRLCKWDDQFDGMPVHRIDAQLYYSLAFYTIGPPDRGNYFVADITSTFEQKLASILAYQTQFPPEKQGIIERVTAMATYFGQSAGFERGEVLSSPRTLGVRDLMGNLFG
ncbi:Mycothiol S-conjugate amidase [Pirellulimonas nuda]|uniref:Mycothiol S-conjugate amidase n=1 Tax=Pirellulimonas nuda TaxID=2528009 RepID=A0A518DGN6_9BACT|nr:PIG-L family deacetylase [Pirellulimonas nuda]QDU90635.1 Mycothiol S-conjugate amidase [Pirellulimonas nuda]